MRKKIVFVFLFLLILFAIFFLYKQYERGKTAEFEKKLELLKEGMEEEEVVKLLGKSSKEGWIKTENMSKEIKEKYSQLYELIYCYSKSALKTFRSRDICIYIYLDKKGGKIIYIFYPIEVF